MSLLWVFREFATHSLSLLWAICDIILMSSPCSCSSAPTVWVANLRTAHSKLKVRAHLVSLLWANWVSSKYSPPWDNSGELSVSMVLSHTFTGKVAPDCIVSCCWHLQEHKSAIQHHPYHKTHFCESLNLTENCKYLSNFNSNCWRNCDFFPLRMFFFAWIFIFYKTSK